MNTGPVDETRPTFEDIFGPIRDKYLVAFLDAVRRAGQVSTAVFVEPVAEMPDTQVCRVGSLGLPYRDDGFVGARMASKSLRIEQQTPVFDEYHGLSILGKLDCDIFPHVWNDVWLCTDPPCSSALQMRVRLWFLDWFQTRLVDPGDTLSGAVHRLDGPLEHGGCHWFHVDLGTAPIEALSTLLVLLAEGGVQTCSIGSRPPFAGSSRP